MRVREWKRWLKMQHSKNLDHGIQLHHFTANRWEKSGNSDRFIFLGSQTTMHSDCSHEIKRRLLLGRKAMTNLDSVLKSRWHPFAKKGPYSQSYGFSSGPLRMWELEHKEGWASKHWCFRIVMLEKILESPWTAGRSNQLILREIKPEHSLEGLMLNLKLQYFGYLMWEPTHWKRPWCWERLKAEEEESNRGWDGWMASLIQWTWTWANSGRWWGTGRPGVLQSMEV